MILTIKTDQPTACIELLSQEKVLDAIEWQAHRMLAETLHQKIDEILKVNDVRQKDLAGVVVYQGPGSFTGLRIGISVANALAYSLNIPVYGFEQDEWAERLLISPDKTFLNAVIPKYGADPHITAQKK